MTSPLPAQDTLPVLQLVELLHAATRLQLPLENDHFFRKLCGEGGSLDQGGIFTPYSLTNHITVQISNNKDNKDNKR